MTSRMVLSDTERSHIEQHGKPEIINSDQGSQFTSDEWFAACEGRLDKHGRAKAGP